jgi:hypothetical protein
LHPGCRVKRLMAERRKHARPTAPCDHLLPGHGPIALGSGRKLLEMAYTEALLKWR